MDRNAEHRCANCYVAQYQMKSDSLCRNEQWDAWVAQLSHAQGVTQ